MPIIDVEIHTAQLNLLAEALRYFIAQGQQDDLLQDPHGESMAESLLGTLEITLADPVPGAIHSVCDTFPVTWEPAT